jgi:hypothetical protein
LYYILVFVLYTIGILTTAYSGYELSYFGKPDILFFCIGVLLIVSATSIWIELVTRKIMRKKRIKNE